MKNLWLVLVMLVCGAAHASEPTIKEMQQEIQDTYEIEVVRIEIGPEITSPKEVYRRMARQVDDAQFQRFLNDFLYQAAAQLLNRGILKRAYPPAMKVVVYPENAVRLWEETFNPFGADIEYIGSDLVAGHRSAKAAIEELVTLPLQSTDEAKLADLERRAINQAILDKVTELKQMGVTVESCSFSKSDCRLSSKNDIAYSTQRRLLEGLVRLTAEAQTTTDPKAAADISWHDSDEFTEKTAMLIRRYMDEIEGSDRLQMSPLSEVAQKPILQ